MVSPATQRGPGHVSVIIIVVIIIGSTPNSRHCRACMAPRGHSTPPTDRPPDKPLGISVFAGCSQEKANTHRTHCQLASFARSSHCLSGLMTTLAANAILGGHAIEQYCVHAVGTSQRSQSGAELDASEVWSVQGQRGTCVTLCHPPPNLGRNLFPPRRFSYHTRFSRFNGTA
jgi:hypothetical protein